MAQAKLFSGLRAATGAANMRGAVDFTDANKFNLYEKGHAILAVVDTPKMMTAIKNRYASNKQISNIIDNFPVILETEFKGLDGLDDMTADTMEITDNISTLNVLGKVNYSTNQEITMRFTEKAGRTITKYSEMYLKAIRDPKTLVKHYMGCADPSVKNSDFNPESSKSIAPGFENEVFTFLYILLDNSWTSVEKAYLLCNCQLTKASYSTLDNVEKGNIELAEIDVPLTSFVVTGAGVDTAAAYIFKNKLKKNYITNSDQLQYKALKELRTTAGISEKTGITETDMNNANDAMVAMDNARSMYYYGEDSTIADDYNITDGTELSIKSKELLASDGTYMKSKQSSTATP